MKLKERDKNLLAIVLCLLIVFLAYFFGLRNITSATATLEKEADKLNLELTNLRTLAAKRNVFIEDTQKYDEQTALLFEKYDTGYSQPYTIKFVEGIQEQTGLWIKSAGLTATQEVFAFGNGTSSNPDRPGQLVYNSDRRGYATTINMTYEGSYDNVKDMIDYVNTYKYKCRIDSLTTSYNSESKLVTGNLTVTIYAITGSDRVPNEPNISNPFFGSENIFHSSTFESSGSSEDNGNHIITNYDVYLSLQAANSDFNAFEMALKEDTTGYSKIVDEDNSSKDVTIRVTGSEGRYNVSYKVGNVTFPVTSYNEGEPIQGSEMLSLLVLSSERQSIDDLSEANVTILNESDQILYIKIVNEDLSNPRFKIAYKEGDIVIYEDKQGE